MMTMISFSGLAGHCYKAATVHAEFKHQWGWQEEVSAGQEPTE